MVHSTRFPTALFVACAACVVCCASLELTVAAGAAGGTPAAGTTVTVEDFSSDITQLDAGLNDFFGNMGAINGQFVTQMTTLCSTPAGHDCWLRFAWNFGQAEDAFTGVFLSVFGLSDTVATFDGVITQTVSFPEHALDLDNVDGAFRTLSGLPHAYNAACVELANRSGAPVTLRWELKDAAGAARFRRVALPVSDAVQTYCVDITAAALGLWRGDAGFDRSRTKLMVFVIERRHVADGVVNPVAGTLDFHHIYFQADRAETPPADTPAMLDRIEYRAAQYFVDWSSRKPASAGLAQDRSTFADLLSVGGAGFGLPAYVIAAERGWLARPDAAQRTVAALRVLDRPGRFCPDRVGCIGTHGFFYHFLGVDGYRKLNFDFPATTRNEALNTVEVSTIDTSLLVLGALVAQSYFDSPTDPIEAEIRRRVQAIYDRVDWPFMFETASQQLYLGWKPDEPRDGPAFEIPDAEGYGKYSGTTGDPATLDFYTDEALIALLLATTSRTHPLPASAWQALVATPDDGGLVRTWPGALFTYQFLHAFVDTRRLSIGPPVDWYANSAAAIRRTIAYAELNPRGFATYGADAWGLSATEGPYDDYHAYGAPPVAVANPPEEDGTVTYYAMLSSLTFGADLRERAVSAAAAGWARGFWHPRFGLPDAFNDDVGQAALDPDSKKAALRQQGQWVQRALFAIDQGPMLLHLENARSGLIWRLTARNPNLARAFVQPRPVLYLPMIVAYGMPGPPTPTLTPSRTSTSTRTPTATATATPTATATATSTSTPTDTPTATPTPTATRTRTPTATSTPQALIVLEAEDGTGDGVWHWRSMASNLKALWLHAGEAITLTATPATGATYLITVRYSNDSWTGPLEQAEVYIDGSPIGSFTAQDTGSGGDGWNNFLWSPVIGGRPVWFSAGSHRITLRVVSGDTYGVEIDCVKLELAP